MEETALVPVTKLMQDLALATSISEVKSIIDKAEALRYIIKKAGIGLEAQNLAAEGKLRAERRAGEMLAERDKHPPGPEPDKLHDVTYPPKLEELGISRIQSHRWQLEKSVP
ncbi:unnamed protein product, partial [marine sediment metagenome]